MKRLALVTILALGCTVEPTGEDGRDDAFLGGDKSDTAGIADNSPEATGVLRAANEATFDTLNDDVGLPSNAAANLIAVRVGDDELPGTADDRTFTSLAQLDDVPFIGPRAFQRLLDYATAQGWIQPPPPPAPTGALTASGTCTVTREYGDRYQGNCGFRVEQDEQRLDVDLRLADGSATVLAVGAPWDGDIHDYTCLASIGLLDFPTVGCNQMTPITIPFADTVAQAGPYRIEITGDSLSTQIYIPTWDRRTSACSGYAVRAFCTLTGPLPAR